MPASPAAHGTGSGRTEPVPIDRAPPASQPELPRDLLEALVAWRQAWQDGDTRTYLSMYDPAFRGTHRSARDWQLERTRRLRERPLRIVLRDVKVRELAADRAVIGWVQDYRSARHADTGWKELVWERQAGVWRITGESWRPLDRPGDRPTF
ncbi:MAG: nuclear transport factor 2 family protein [Comamonadaceae bacterium]|nr:MAG: nuclear transport factor 2 family protein [Comamonadaceae bacterium]